MSTSSLSLAVPVDRGTDRLLYAAYAVPVLYFATLFIAAALYPGYSHVSQYASELGSASARYPGVFNAGTLLGGVAGLFAALGMYRGLRSIGTGRLLATLVALTIASNAAAFLFGGWFPMPDERHGGYGVGMGVLLGPPLAALAFRRLPRDLRWVSWLLAVNAVLAIALFTVMMGVGELVTRANVGLWQRAFSLSVFPWIGLAAWAVLRWRNRVA